MMIIKKGIVRPFFIVLFFVVGLLPFFLNTKVARADTVTVDGQTFTYNMTRSYGPTAYTDAEIRVGGGYNQGLTNFTNGWRTIDVSITYPSGNTSASGVGTTCATTFGCTYTHDGSMRIDTVSPNPGAYTATFFFRVTRRISNVQTDTFTQTRTITYTVTAPAPTANITATGPVAFESENLWQKTVSFFTGRDHVARASGSNPSILVGQNARINWSSTGADSCSISNGIGSVAPNAPGNQRLTGLSQGSHTYTITCRKSGFADVTDSVTVIVTNPTGYTVTASAGAGGSIAPSGTFTGVPAGSSRSFSITANSGYSISSVTVNGANWGATSSINLSNINQDYDIVARFSVDAVGGASCPAGMYKSWSANGNSCDGYTNATSDGQLGGVTDGVAPTTGSAQYRCNNGSWAASPQSGQTCVFSGGTPDLLSRFAATPVASGSLVQGQSVTFTGFTSNQGAASAGPSFFDSFEYCWGVGCTPTTLISNVFQPTLVASSNRSETSGSLSLSQSGTLRVRYCADNPNLISESNEGNNCETQSFTVNPAVATQPNLTVVRFDGGTGGPNWNNPVGIQFMGSAYNSFAQTAAGQTIWADIEIDWNNGNSCAAPSIDAVRTAGGPWSNVGYASAGINWNSPGGINAIYYAAELQNGTHCYRFVVDRGGFVTESNESDNATAWRQITITGLAVPQSNLLPNPVGSLTVNGALTQGNNVTFTDWVFNANATSTSVGFTDSFRYCWGGGCAPGTMIGGHAPQGVLTGNATRPDTSSSFTLSSSGTLRVQYCVDSQAQIAESNEGDNCRIADFTISAVAVPSHTVTITAGPGGTSSPIGVITVPDGTAVPRIWFQPSGSNTVQTVVSNGLDFGPLAFMDLGYIGINRTVHVTFNIVAATCGSRQGGTPSSPQVVTASTSGAAVWGSGPFTNDSDLGKIARFLGVPLGWTATLSIADLGCVSSFTGSTANGITTFGWSEYRGMSVSVISQVPPAGQPDLMSQNLSLVTAGPYTQNVTVQVGAWAINNGTVGTLLGFTDRFEYQYNGTGGAWSNFPGQSTIVNGALAAGTPVVDQLGFNPPSVGSIYFRHCVDINNAIPESDNNNNCAVIGPITINAPLAPSRLDICPASATVNVGGTQPFAAYFTNQGTAFDGCAGTSVRSNMVASTTWGTTNASVATVSTSGTRGVVTGQSVGSTAVTATFGGLVAPNAPVTVINACVRTAQCTDASAVATAANTCTDSTFTISDACGSYSCSGVRSCDYNWKEVAP